MGRPLSDGLDEIFGQTLRIDRAFIRFFLGYLFCETKMSRREELRSASTIFIGLSRTSVELYDIRGWK